MIRTSITNLPVLQYKVLQSEKSLIHFVTTRQGGISKDKFRSLNLSYKGGDTKMNVNRNRSILLNELNIESGKILFPNQCHTNHIKRVDDGTNQDDLKETDALITNCKNLCISVLAADCVPLILYDPENRAIGVVHSGWRGTTGRIVARTIEQLVKSYGTKPEKLLACIGPAISQQKYEVGDEVVEQFKFWFADTPVVFPKNNVTGKFHVDLWEANRQLLLRYGVHEKNIEVAALCTYEHPELFFSARRDGLHCGRFASGIMLT